MSEPETAQNSKQKINRRTLFKATGAASAALGLAGIAASGYQAGKSPDTYTGCEGFQGSAQTFDRKRFAKDKPHYEIVGPTSRPDRRTGNIFVRVGKAASAKRSGLKIEDMPEPYRSYYLANPEHFEMDANNGYLRQKVSEDTQENKNKYILAQAWANAMGAVNPQAIRTPPQDSDFDKRISADPYKMKSPEATAKLIKKVSYEFGSVLTGITKLNPDWVYRYPAPNRGFHKNDELTEIPEHWQYAIVVGSPMSWDPMFANPNYGTSNDAYSRSRITAFRLASFIKRLGYGARPHTPGNSYDLMVPPIMVDAGLGEQGRHSIVITPELGCNFRPSVITTNIPMKTDKPISFGVQNFCKTCKICAEQCPSGAISKGQKETIRGYKRYALNSSKCFNFWSSKHGSMGCRVCVASCPYTRKSNWVHKSALQVTANDPTGLSHKALTAMQKRFYPGQNPSDYYAETLGGKNASYRKPPWWLVTEDFIEL